MLLGLCSGMSALLRKFLCLCKYDRHQLGHQRDSRAGSTQSDSLLLEWQGEAVNDTAKNLEQLGHTVVLRAFVNVRVEYAVDGSPNERPVRHEFAVGTVQDCLQVVALSRVL
jgi:hypothetical protein